MAKAAMKYRQEVKLNPGIPLRVLPRRQWTTLGIRLVGLLNALLFSFGLSFQPLVPTKSPRQHQRGAALTSPVRFPSLSLAAASSSSKLIPEENPNVDPSQKSLSGVPFTEVLGGLAQLYPPEALEERNAASRTDGYWPFIQLGEDPPKQFTYGEFDFTFFAELLDRVHTYYYEYKGREDESSSKHQAWDDKVFCDIGSGTGRLVLGAAALHPGWKLCRGIEILHTISDVAQTKLDDCRFTNENEIELEIDAMDHNQSAEVSEQEEEWVENEQGLLVKAKKEEDVESQLNDQADDHDDEHVSYRLPTGGADSGERIPLAPVELVCGSFDDPYNYFGDVDCVFCFSSCMSTSILQSLSQSIGRQCRPGAIVITTDFPLILEGIIPPYPDDESLPHGNYELELLEDMDGYCWLTGGQSTAYIHQVKQSLWDGSGPRVKPKLPASEKAFRAIKAMEEKRDDSAVRFLNGVRNNMFFVGFPEPWLPDPSNYVARKDEEEEGDPL